MNRSKCRRLNTRRRRLIKTRFERREKDRREEITPREYKRMIIIVSNIMGREYYER